MLPESPSSKEISSNFFKEAHDFCMAIFLGAMPIKNNTDGTLVSGILSIIYGSYTALPPIANNTPVTTTLLVYDKHFNFSEPKNCFVFFFFS